MRKARIDTTATALTALARQMGALVLPLNGSIDALIQTRRGTLVAVDFKTKRGKRLVKTATQTRLVQEGWNIAFVSTPEELMALVTR